MIATSIAAGAVIVLCVLLALIFDRLGHLKRALDETAIRAAEAVAQSATAKVYAAQCLERLPERRARRRRAGDTDPSCSPPGAA